MSSTDVASTPPAEKKIKMSYPMAPDEDWPAAWLMPDTVEDQCLPNQLAPPVPQSAADMKALGICYWKMDAESYDYPVKAVPWNPADATDPKLQALRDDRGAYLSNERRTLVRR
jgi:1,2-dihydroxy-3-keto-5-methylthiopentene dioxygenase